MIKELNPSLAVNVRIFNVKTDKEERKTQYNLRKINIDMRKFKTFKDAESEHQKQKDALDKKWKSLQDLIIWAMNNGREVVFTNIIDDDKE